MQTALVISSTVICGDACTVAVSISRCRGRPTAAISVLAVNPEANLTDIARAAGLSRQALYVHFGSARSIARGRYATADGRRVADARRGAVGRGGSLDGSEMIPGRLPEAPRTVRTGGRRGCRRSDCGGLESVAGFHQGADHRTSSSGQRAGDFTSAVSAEWLAASTIALGHISFELQASVGLSEEYASESLAYSIRRLCRADGSRETQLV